MRSELWSIAAAAAVLVVGSPARGADPPDAPPRDAAPATEVTNPFHAPPPRSWVDGGLGGGAVSLGGGTRLWARAAESPALREARQEDDADDDAAEEANLDARLAFLQDRIARQYLHAEIWWTGFTTLFAGGIIASSLRAGLSNTRSEQVNFSISAIKAGVGVARKLADPYGGIRGTESFAGLPEASLDDKRFKVAEAERVLANNAEETHVGGIWYGHLINLALNAAHVMIMGFGYDDWSGGAISGAVGAAIGEASLLLSPWEADGDLEEYATRFGVDLAPEEMAPREPAAFRLTIVPTGAGAGLQLAF